jgi:hypothetical protein
MSRARISIRVDDKMISVRGWRAADHLRSAGKRPVFSGTSGWMLDRRHLGDVLAYFESRNITVVITDVDQLELPEPPDGGEAA